nr:transposase [Streptomyces cupreus]
MVYRQGITEGAPNAVQVSDRFHLWQGLSKRVGDVAAAHRGCLTAAVPEPEPALPPSPAAPPDQADTPARRHAKNLFEAVHAVTDTGCSINAAAHQLGLNRRTVRKYARAATWQECVRAHCRELDRTHGLVRQFAAMLDARDAAPLADWLEQLATSRLPALASLAKAIREDQPAVVQGITTPFNSGVNEGRITDLKLQKRIMAGRAGVPLLRHRVILMALLRRRFP